jgi:hypothetical protein
MAEAGYTSAEIDALADAGAILVADASPVG